MGLLGYYFAIFMLVLAAVTFVQFVYSEIKRRQARVQLTPDQLRSNAEAQAGVITRLQQQHAAGAEEYKWEQERIRRQKREEGLRLLREADERARNQASYRTLRGSPLYAGSSTTSSYSPSPAENAAVSEARQLREEQDREYAMALLEDQQKELERQQLQEQVRQEELARVQRQAELASKRARIEALSEPDSSCTEVAEVQIRLPDGTRLLRRCVPDAPLQDLLDLVDITIPSLHNRFHLATTFPKRAYRDGEQTMADAGFVPNASLVVMQD